MSEDQWRAPGRERSAHDGAAPGPYPPPPSPAGSPSPYLPPDPASQTARPGAFATSDRHRAQVLGGQGYDSPAYRNDSVAVTAMVLGVVGVVVPGVCLVAVALGHLALRRLRTSYEGGRGLAVAALVLGYVTTAIWLSVLLVFLTARSFL
ncbi:DUF4190 domain-containing protein [Georgenia sp. H159]|uniref:DUF4190 domain-containing protein n=1 Tax=Georgenia sp. H159 TaxID=3076115 RepID=UPI002D77F4B5|nr:DUF4190 domain-containing protein [Georgenia sp. H159]